MVPSPTGWHLCTPPILKNCKGNVRKQTSQDLLGVNYMMTCPRLLAVMIKYGHQISILFGGKPFPCMPNSFHVLHSFLCISDSKEKTFNKTLQKVWVEKTLTSKSSSSTWNKWSKIQISKGGYLQHAWAHSCWHHHCHDLPTIKESETKLVSKNKQSS